MRRLRLRVPPGEGRRRVPGAQGHAVPGALIRARRRRPGDVADMPQWWRGGGGRCGSVSGLQGHLCCGAVLWGAVLRCCAALCWRGCRLPGARLFVGTGRAPDLLCLFRGIGRDQIGFIVAPPCKTSPCQHLFCSYATDRLLSHMRACAHSPAPADCSFQLPRPPQNTPSDYQCPVCGAPKSRFESRMKVRAGLSIHEARRCCAWPFTACAAPCTNTNLALPCFRPSPGRPPFCLRALCVAACVSLPARSR